MRQYRWRVGVRSYEGDAWGCLPAAGFLRYMEHSAVEAASAGGYDSAFHAANNSAWVIRRMTLLLPGSAQQGDELDITTWATHFSRVRGGREYVVDNAGGEQIARGLAEWVYVDRTKLTPIAIPRSAEALFEPPGAPLLEYDAPALDSLGQLPLPIGLPTLSEPVEQTVRRTAEWHECDSVGHVNNTYYVSWLDDAVFAALEAEGISIMKLREQGFRLHGVYYKLDYKRAILPLDKLAITTRIERQSGPAYQATQRIAGEAGEVVTIASSVYVLKRET